MAVLPVLEWVPDAAALGNKGSVRIVNAVPGTNSYKPFPSFAVLTDALTGYARGAIDVRDRDGNVFQYAGDETALYQLSGTSWEDITRVESEEPDPYATGTEERWEFVRWKNQVLATNFSDEPQKITLGGTNFEDLTSDFRCRRLAVVKDFVVAANTFDSSDGNVSDRVRWSAFNNEADWTVSPSTGADFRDLKGGPVLKVFGGEYGTILASNSVYRMEFTGAPDFFQINETVPDIGVLGPGAAARIGSTVFMWSNQGFVAVTSASGTPAPIGAGKVDRYAFQDLDDSYLHRISCVADPKSGRVFWAYPGAGNSGGRPNRIIVYDRALNRWGLIEQEVELLWRAGGVGFTLEQLDDFSASLDDLEVSLDSSQWKGGGAILMGAFNSERKHGFFDGQPMTATVDTAEREIHAGHRTQLNSFRALVDGGSVTAQVGRRDDLADEVAWGPVLSKTGSGRFTCRVNARYHRFRLHLSGNWSDAIGTQIEADDARRAGGR